ncbi:hypothetical protein BHM03_00059627, partial [Ensete ventricosum]
TGGDNDKRRQQSRWRNRDSQVGLGLPFICPKHRLRVVIVLLGGTHAPDLAGAGNREEPAEEVAGLRWVSSVSAGTPRKASL